MIQEDYLLLELPIPIIKCVESAGNYGRFVAEPLETGFSVTLGNAMRRVLLSSLPGAATTWVKIEGIKHEFSPIPCVKEDVIEFLLNVRELRLRPLSYQPGKLFLEVEGEGKVCAADIKPSADFQIANPELYLATLDSSQAKLYVELNVELGRGYIPAKSADGLPVGALPVDAIFTPVRKANFLVESIRLGEERSAERLVLEVWTDGTISPREAVSQSADILINQFVPFRALEVPVAEQVRLGGGLLIPPDQYDTPLDELGLSTRARNSLRRGGISNLGQLVEKSREGLLPLPGLGAKSQSEVEELITKLGFPINFETKKGEGE
ncbi:MAG: DNA-directed RNA polymerase subunit alpha [Chloroflexi bacterium CG07_land_8_20_14_0_80_45_17]|nr:MAG: DNA-directed RNA polymerase subunit alpha [Chloroflexi bacterium CG23_combo_of_CG06-09_8_20_14_all_45_10]PIU55840.1 MAG: DNA-directed RNA polymerase subunit alpha [Chloroflexi bacterium CG07_land_8_20_14_0_80_45_17]